MTRQDTQKIVNMYEIADDVKTKMQSNMASNFEAMKAKSGRKKRRDSKHKKTSSE